MSHVDLGLFSEGGLRSHVDLGTIGLTGPRSQDDMGQNPRLTQHWALLQGRSPKRRTLASGFQAQMVFFQPGFRSITHVSKLMFFIHSPVDRRLNV